MIPNINTTNNISRIINSYTDGALRVGKTSGLNMGTDEFTISSESRDFRAVFEAVSKLPDIREDKVNDIKARMDSGRYNVSSMDTARKMLMG